MDDELGKPNIGELEPRTKDIVFVNIAGEPRSDKRHKGEGWQEGKVFQAGDDAGFIFLFPENKHGIICAGAALDGVSEGGMGHVNAYNSAKELRRTLEARFIKRKRFDRKGRYTRDEVGGIIAKGILPDINVRRFEEQKRLKKESQLEKPYTYGSGLALFVVQEGFDNTTGQRVPYLHGFFTADCDIEVYIGTEDGNRRLVGMNIPHNIAGDKFRKEQKLETGAERIIDDRGKLMGTVDFAPNLTLVEMEKLLGEKKAAVERDLPRAAGAVTSLIGDPPERFRIYYTRVRLPQEGDIYSGSKINKLRVVALTDGVEGHSSKKARMEAISRGANPLEESQRLVNLVHDKDRDDRLAVVAQVNLAPRTQQPNVGP